MEAGQPSSLLKEERLFHISVILRSVFMEFGGSNASERIQSLRCLQKA